MTASEFAEQVMGIPLCNWQKEYMDKMHKIYKENPEAFKELHFRMNSRNNSRTTWLKMVLPIIFFELQKENKDE